MVEFSQDATKKAVVSAAVTLAGVAAILWITGIGVTAGQMVTWFLVFVILSFFVRRQADITVGSILFGVGIVVLFIEYLVPGWITEQFTWFVELTRASTGIDIAALGDNAIAFFVLVVAFVPVMIFLRIRFTKRSFSKSATELTAERFSRIIREWSNIIGAVIVFVFATLTTIMFEGAEVIGVIGSEVAQAPHAAGNFILGITGYLSLGGTVPGLGEVPLFGELTAAGFGVFAFAVIVLAVAARTEGSGPLAQFLENR